MVTLAGLGTEAELRHQDKCGFISFSEKYDHDQACSRSPYFGLPLAPAARCGWRSHIFLGGNATIKVRDCGGNDVHRPDALT